MTIYFKHIVQLLVDVHMPFWCLFSDSQPTTQLIYIDIHLISDIQLSTSTLSIQRNRLQQMCRIFLPMSLRERFGN